MSEEHRSGRRQSEPWALEALERLYDEAVCHGADVTGGRDGGERYAAPLDLLASSTIHVPQLVLLMAVLEEASEAADADITTSVAGEVVHCSAGLMRLGQRALQAHARDVGYDSGMWRAEAVIQTAVALSVGVSRGADDDLGLAALELRRATVALADGDRRGADGSDGGAGLSGQRLERLAWLLRARLRARYAPGAGALAPSREQAGWWLEQR